MRLWAHTLCWPYACRKVVPRRASSSTTGVWATADPKAPTASARSWSGMNSTRFGLVTATSASQLGGQVVVLRHRPLRLPLLEERRHALRRVRLLADPPEQARLVFDGPALVWLLQELVHESLGHRHGYGCCVRGDVVGQLERS